ncbi:MAG: hypothetical protein VKL39_23685 [Leptolyngbyaceae bacterium]|nr:hypothetical protein [Leptolyngbyaceae bacterium]
MDKTLDKKVFGIILEFGVLTYPSPLARVEQRNHRQFLALPNQELSSDAKHSKAQRRAEYKVGRVGVSDKIS